MSSLARFRRREGWGSPRSATETVGAAVQKILKAREQAEKVQQLRTARGREITSLEGQSSAAYASIPNASHGLGRRGLLRIPARVPIL